MSEVRDESEDGLDADSIAVASASSIGSAGTEACAAPDGTVDFVALISPDEPPIAFTTGPSQFGFLCQTDVCVLFRLEWCWCIAAGLNLSSKVMPGTC